MKDQAAPLPKVTIRTVATDAGVSVAAVSKVLRNAYGVSDRLRERVNASIQKLNYRPSTAARGLRGRTYTIGVLTVELRNPFLPIVVESANAALLDAGFNALIGVGQSRVTLETALIESMIDHNVDGLILISPRLPRDVIRRFASQKPIVVIGQHLSEEASFDTVNADDIRGGEMAVEELVSLGHSEIGMLNLADQSEFGVSTKRTAGYARAMVAAGLGSQIRIAEVARAEFEPDQRNQLSDWLALPDRPSAVFCWSDLTAIPLLAVATERGVLVPTDLAVVGYDNSTVAALPQVSLTSIDQSGHDLGAKAAEVLVARINGRTDPHHVLLEPRIVRRASTQRS